MNADTPGTLEPVIARAVNLAHKRGHLPGPFEPTQAKNARGELVAAASASCINCGGEIFALSGGETSAPRLCRDGVRKGRR
jgi:hypothetical protein